MTLRRPLLAVTFGLLLVGTALPVMAQNADERTAGTKPQVVQNNSDTYRQLNLFGDVFERVRSQYVDEMTDEELVETAINGMLVSLDPHSGYLDEDDFTEMQVQTRGEFGGLGIEVTMENGIIKVVSPIDDTPAFRAGVQPGDYITHLDDEAIVGFTLSEAVEKMRGKVGTPIKLTIRREGEAEALDLTLTRDIIKIQSVRYEVLENSIGYIRVTTFNQNTDVGVQKAVNDIKATVGDNLVGYIIDLRNNPGGLLDQAISVSDAFLDKGEIVSTRGRHEIDTKRDNATAGDLAAGLPLVVMI
ncbi:MAG: S41 family peptidase, partial [Alphaproteobacteria bacterium]|nr:S41 family peptidase [Alphaproteobacteria bacterium]